MNEKDISKLASPWIFFLILLILIIFFAIGQLGKRKTEQVVEPPLTKEAISPDIREPRGIIKESFR